MKFDEKNPPREYTAGYKEDPVRIKDCGSLYLGDDEQITFVTSSGAEYDVCRKYWGYYATPSTNGRLRDFGFKTALVDSGFGKYYIWLVEKDKIPEFETYAKAQKHDVVFWLDDDKTLEYLEKLTLSMKCICSDRRFEKVCSYDKRPEGETDFKIPEEDYYREYWKCCSCGHYITKMDIDIDAIYEQDYADSTYGDKLEEIYNKIINLPEDKSDNTGRVDCIKSFAGNYFQNDSSLSILDVGSGLCVFLDRIKKVTNWKCTALDPDPRQSSHARDVVGVNAVQADFIKNTNDIGCYDIITFNKVLEHVEDPVYMLGKAKNCLKEGGFVYVELPDGTMAMHDSYLREEFFIEHLHVFSITSISVLAERAGFNVVEVTRLREPSGKYTLRAFLVNN